MKKILTILLLIIMGASFFMKAKAAENKTIRRSEAYELANIILALTPYGKADQWEVAKNSAYYKEVLAYFAPYTDHPLLKNVNYAREKWDSYLSFRTDAYVFTFDRYNQLKRTTDFYANDGLKPFDDNLALINDFVKVSGFRRFYKAHLKYYLNLGSNYLKSQRYPEMLSFLEKEFAKGKVLATYAIAISPLVGRMNCHRTVNNVETDFITLPDFLLADQTENQASIEELASGTHMLFTELDHGSINPITAQYQTLLKTNFDNSKWDTGSGYENDESGTFNEYMTWGVYDIYVKTYFPTVAEKISADWALQNETRGFYASALFNAELKTLYNSRKEGQTLKDLYPALLDRLGKIQKDISKPIKLSCNLDNKVINDSTAVFIVQFSEPMQELDTLDMIKTTDEKGSTKKREILTRSANQLKWSENGTILTFSSTLKKDALNYIIFNHPWGTLIALKSKKGVNLPPYTMIKITVR